MNNFKKIFLFLAVLLVVLTPGFNKLQAAETVIITKIEPNNQATGSQFGPFTVEFTTDFVAWTIVSYVLTITQDIG